MTNEEVAELRLGDVVKHEPTGFHFIVINTLSEQPQVETTVHIEHPEEWTRADEPKQ